MSSALASASTSLSFSAATGWLSAASASRTTLLTAYIAFRANAVMSTVRLGIEATFWQDEEPEPVAEPAPAKAVAPLQVGSAPTWPC